MGTRCSCTFQQLMKSPMCCFFLKKKRYSYSVLTIMILSSNRIHKKKKKARGHFQRRPACWGETVPAELGKTWMFDTKLSSSVVFWPQGHVICCCSLGRPKDGPVELMFPNMLMAPNVGTIHRGQKEGCDLEHVTRMTKIIISPHCIVAFQLNIISVKQFIWGIFLASNFHI